MSLPNINLAPLTSQEVLAKNQLKEAYSSYWNNIRFKKGWDQPVFSREDVAHQLDEIAEVVVRIRSVLDKNRGTPKTRILEGNANEYMWSIHQNPAENDALDEFVRGMVNATFLDMDGYVESLSEEYINAQIDLLKDFWRQEDKTASSIDAITKTLEQIQECWNSFKDTNDLQSLTLQHQKDIKNIAFHLKLLKSDFSSLNGEEEKSEEAETQDAMELEESNELDQISEKNIIQVNRVEHDVSEIKSEVQKVLQDVQGYDHLTDIGDYKVAKQTVDQLQEKVARFQAQLMDDMLALDSIVGDQNIRPLRKKQIITIQGMLGDLDKISAKLNSFEAELNKHAVEEAEHTEVAKELEELQRLEKLAELEEESARKHSETEQKAKDTLWSKKDEDSTEMTDAEEDLVERWKSMRLSPNFKVNRQPNGYIIEAYIPGLSRDELSITLKDQNQLVLSGLRLPNEEEMEIMRRRIPEGLSEEELENAMLRMGVGRFGRFVETYEIPPEVDKDGIKASYQGGVFRVVVPLQTPAIPSRRHPFFADNNLWW